MQTNILDMAEFKDMNDAPDYHKPQQSLSFNSLQLESRDYAPHLANVLQSTLELSKLLELFNQELSTLIVYEGLSYNNKTENYRALIGSEAQNRLAYRLVLIDDDLGELSLYRNDNFTRDEVEILENTVAALIYPLRNAILYKQALEKAYRDPLTGVNNRAALDKVLCQEISLAKRHTTPLSIIMLDIDRFKNVNDNYGHIAGDAVLKRVAESMVECARDSDLIYRYGGEEFLMLLRNTDEAGAMLVAERVRKAIENTLFKCEGHDIRVTASQGLATLNETDDLEGLLGHCDRALYLAKSQGRNQVSVS